jgi:signal transduction histidine kinase
MNIFHPRNWSRYSRRFTGDKEGLRKYKRVILLSQFTLFGSIVGVFHSIEDLVDGLLFMPMMDMIMAVSIFVCYVLNENGKHRLARILLLSFLNIFFFVYSSLANHAIGIYLYYFSWVGLAAVVFEANESFYRFFFIGLSITLTIILIATNFNVFGPVEYAAIDIGRSFIINLVSSMAVLVFFIVFMVNMNEHSEKKLIELASEVRAKNTDLERVNHELDRFFYSASHDLRVPLLDIRGAIHAAMAELKDEEVTTYFLILKERADKLDQFLQDIIDYSRNAQTGLRLEAVNLNKLVDDAIENFTFVKGADKISFRKEIELKHEVEVDRIRLLIVLNNVLSNAIKYHRADQKDLWIRITAQYENDTVTMSIADNGPGIEEDLLPKIFNMFFRGTNVSKGSGLGLYIVKETLAKMNGSIQAQSQVGTGTVFTITLPAKPAKAPAYKRIETPAIQRSVDS